MLTSDALKDDVQYCLTGIKKRLYRIVIINVGDGLKSKMASVN